MSPEPRVPAFAVLTAERGYQLASQTTGSPSQWHETIVADDVAMRYAVDRGDVDRSVSLGGFGGPRRFELSDLLARLKLESTGTDEDFLTAVANLDKAAIDRLHRGP